MWLLEISLIILVSVVNVHGGINKSDLSDDYYMITHTCMYIEYNYLDVP